MQFFRNMVTRIKTMGHNAFIAVRDLVFSIMYPAPQIFNRSKAKYQQIRKDFIKDTKSKEMYCGFNGEVYSAATAHRDKYFHGAIFDLKGYLTDPSKSFIIMTDGNGTCFEQFDQEMQTLSENHNAVVIGFNPPGVGMSPGKIRTPKEYQDCISAIINNLIHERNVRAENITLCGRSWGAAMSLIVANKYQQAGYRIKVIADRTFARLDTTAGTMARKVIPHIPILRNIIALLLYFPVKRLVNLLGLNVDAAAAFQNINKLNPGDAIGLSVLFDGVIPTSCNLYNNVPERIRKEHMKNFAVAVSLADPEYDYYERKANMVPAKEIYETEYAKPLVWTSNRWPYPSIYSDKKQQSGAAFISENLDRFAKSVKAPLT